MFFGALMGVVLIVGGSVASYSLIHALNRVVIRQRLSPTPQGTREVRLKWVQLGFLISCVPLGVFLLAATAH